MGNLVFRDGALICEDCGCRFEPVEGPREFPSEFIHECVSGQVHQTPSDSAKERYLRSKGHRVRSSDSD